MQQTSEGQHPHNTSLQRLVDVTQAWEKGPNEMSFVHAARQAGAQADDVRKLDIWLALQPLGSPSPGQRAESGMRWLQALASVSGLFLGAGFMAALIAYDGSRQVNALWLLGFALLQLVLSLLALSGVAMLVAAVPRLLA